MHSDRNYPDPGDTDDESDDLDPQRVRELTNKAMDHVVNKVVKKILAK